MIDAQRRRRPDRRAAWAGHGDRRATGSTASGAATARDRLFGGAGNDRLWGQFGADMSWGEDGDDLMGGGPGNDRQCGGNGNDTIYAARGQRRDAGARTATTRCGRWPAATCTARTTLHGDTLHGGPGNDTFRTRDGEADVIDCGPGIDTALIDFKDVLTNPAECEVVNRARHRSGEDRRESADPTEDVSPRD